LQDSNFKLFLDSAYHTAKSSSSKSPPGILETNQNLQNECEKLQQDLLRAQKSIERLKQREKELITRYSRYY